MSGMADNGQTKYDEGADGQMTLHLVDDPPKQEKKDENMLRCINDQMLGVRDMTKEDLFGGYDDADIITFSYDLPMIDWIMQRIKHARLIIGADFKVRNNKNVDAIANALAVEHIAKTHLRTADRLVQRMKDGDLEVRTSSTIVDHRKLYLLHATDSRVRSIHTSANLTMSAWNQRQLEDYRYDDTRFAYDTNSETFETAWSLALPLPYKTIAMESVDDPTKASAILNGVEETGHAVILQEPDKRPETATEYQYALEIQEAVEKYNALCTNIGLKKDPNGLVLIKPDNVEKIRLNFRKAEIKKTNVQVVQKKYPRLKIDYDAGNALLDDKVLEAPSEQEVREDIDILLHVFKTYETFVGTDPREQQRIYYKLLNVMFASPFFAELRCVAGMRDSSPERTLPLYALVSSTHSDTGKTFFVKIILKMMTGVDRLPVLGTRQCNSTNAAALQADGCGVPILIDEIDNRFLTNMETTIKTVNQVCEQQQNNQIPLLIFASNDATAPKSTLLKRMAFFNPEGTMPSNVDLSECDSIGKFMIKNASNALYREYLHRMIPKIWELIKQADSEVKKGIYSGWYPDAMPMSSTTLIEILNEYGYDVPDYFTELSWNENFATNSADAINSALDDICELYRSDKSVFEITRMAVTVTLNNDSTSQKRMKSWQETLPREVVRSNLTQGRSEIKIVFNREELEKRTGIKFKKGLFR